MPLAPDPRAAVAAETTNRILARQLEGRVYPLPAPSLSLTYDSARDALEGIALYAADGHLVRAYEANGDPDDFTWTVDVWEVMEEEDRPWHAPEPRARRPGVRSPANRGEAGP